ncbi:MAG: hypothetical protein RIR29_79 [Actinomycetota bacterium]
MLKSLKLPLIAKLIMTTLLVSAAVLFGQQVFAAPPQVAVMTEAAGCAKAYYCVVQPVITDVGAADGTVITATSSGSVVLANATAIVTNGVATFQGFQFSSGGTGGTSYTITFSDGTTTATQVLTYYEAWGNVTVGATDSGAGATWVNNSSFSTNGGQAAQISASTLATKLANGDVYLIANGITISSAISYTGNHTLYIASAGIITVNASITATQGGSVIIYDMSTGNTQTPVVFAAAANVTTNGGNFSVSSWLNNGLDPVQGIGNVVNFNGNTIDVGSGSVYVNAKSIKYAGSISGACINLASATIKASGSGNITLKATPVSNSGFNQTSAVGIKIGSASTIQVADGAINLSSTANTAATTATSSLGGIVLTGASGSLAVVKATGTGSITMNGAVGDVSNWESTGFDGGKSTGVQINRYSSVTTASGDISLTGTTGNLTQTSFPSTGSMTGADTLGYYGVRIGDAANAAGSQPTVSAGGNGNITITGTSGISTINYGTYVEGGTIATANGTISITGTASSDAGTKTAVSIGVVLSGQTTTTLGSSITSSGGGAISIVGSSGANTFSGTGNGSSEGVRIGQSTVDTTGGTLTISGTTNGLGTITVAATGGGTAQYLHNGVAFARPATGYNQLYPTGSTTTSIGASASAVTVNGYTGSATNASGISWFKFLGTTFGGSNCTANFTFNADRMLAYYVYGTTSGNFYVDTSGSVSVHSVNSDFASGDVISTTATYSPALMISPRVSSLEITPTTATSSRAIAVQQDTVMNSANFSMHVRGGDVTVSSYADTGTVGNLGVEANGNFTLNKLPATNLALQFTGASRNTVITPGTRTIQVNPTDAAGVAAVWGVPSQLAIVSGTPAPNAAVAFNSHVIQAKDAYGNALTASNIYGDATVDSDGPTATVDLTTANGATFTGGSTAINVVSGATGVSFTGLTIDLPGTYSLTYSGTFRGVALTQVTSANFVVGGGAPTITLVYPSVTYAPTGTIAPTTATVSSGGTKTYSTTSANTICTVNSSTGAITPVGGGTCSVTLTAAAVAGPPSYLSGSLTVDVTINKAAQAAVTMTTLSISYGATATLSAAGGSGNGSYVYSTTSTGCSLSGAVLSSTLGATNTCTVSVYRAGNSQYLDSGSVDFTVTVVKANQTSLGSPSGITLTYGGSLDLTTLTYTGGSGTGAMSWTTATTGCTITGTILTSTNSVGGSSCIVAATKALDSNYNVSNTSNATIAITKANQSTITITSTSATYGSTLALTSTGGDGGGLLTWSVVSGACAVSVTTLTPSAAGSCVIKVSKAASTNYNASTSADTTVTIAKGAQSAVSFTSAATLSYAGSRTLGVAGGSGTGAFTITTATTGCLISGVTLTSTLDAGNTCLLTAVRAGDANWNDSASIDQSVTIVKANQVSAMSVPSGVTIVYGSAGLDLSTLTYSGGDGTGAYGFTTSTSGCTIAGTTLTSTNNAAATCSINVVKAADVNYNASSAGVMSVTITKATQTAITVTSTSVTYPTTLTLTSTGGTSAGAITFSKVSGNCTISGAVMTPTGAGSCVVTATMAGGTNYNDVVSANTTVTIAKANQAALSWNLGSTSVAYLGSLTLATTGGTGTGAVVYSVSNNSACSIVGSTLYPSSVGSVCDITATKVADSNYNSADTATQSITVTPIAQAALNFTSASVMTYGSTLNVLAVGGTGSGSISYAISNAGTTGCTLASDVLSVTASGTCVISAARAASTNYLASATLTQSITVNKANKTVSFSSTIPALPIVGGTYTVVANVTGNSQTATFSIGSGGCTISGAVVTFTGAGNCRIDANSASTSQYNAAPLVSQTVVVGQRNQNLTFNAATLAITTKAFGDLAFNAVATSSVPTLSPSFAAGSNTTNNACLVSSAGVVTVVAVGRCEIVASQAGDADTTAASPISTTIDVIADYANAPTIVSVSASHESITAAFIAPSYTGGASVSGYQMVAVYSGGQIANTGCAVVAGSSQSCTVTGLTNGTPYTIKVAAINSRGVGSYSGLSASRVPATNPAAVGALTVIPDNTTLQLSWVQPVSLGGGTFDSYRIFIKPAGTANYPLTYMTVNTLGANGYQFTNLVNGQAYDVRVVTVTTANTLSLESNTAEAAETPRTVPDAPASILMFELNGNIVISWTSPNSDGGSAVTAYQATMGGTACVLTTPTDTTCVIAAPTAPGVYPIDVKAQNAAGLGLAVSTTFTRAGVNQGQPTNPYLMEVLGFNIRTLSATGGQVLIVKARNMDDVTQVLVDGKPVKILSIGNGEIQVQMPAHADGIVAMTFTGPKGTVVFQNAVTYQSGVAKLLLTTIGNYIEGNSTLSKSTQLKLTALIKSHPNAVSVTCIGYQSVKYTRAIDAKVAKQRAVNACNFLKAKNPKLTIKSVVARTPLVGPASRKLEIQLRDISN